LRRYAWIGGHTYMLKEKPRLYVTTALDDTMRMANFTAGLNDYCNMTLTDFGVGLHTLHSVYEVLVARTRQE
jgi:hypothetical protein